MTTKAGTAAAGEDYVREEAILQRERAWDSLHAAARTKQAERERLKALNLRPCPKCAIALETRTVKGVEIDRCNSCKGIWLDDGQLELLTQKKPGRLRKILAKIRGGKDRSTASAEPSARKSIPPDTL
jgi:Zn-finger nucleic acid-binding protein